MDLVFDSIEIYPDPAEKKAYGRIHVAEVSLQGSETIAAIISGLASIPAERLLRPHKGQFELILGVCKDDFDQSNEICKQFGFDLDLLLREAGRIVRRQAPSIYRVAEALEKKNLLLYDEVLDYAPKHSKSAQLTFASPLQMSQAQARDGMRITFTQSLLLPVLCCNTVNTPPTSTRSLSCLSAHTSPAPMRSMKESYLSINSSQRPCCLSRSRQVLATPAERCG